MRGDGRSRIRSRQTGAGTFFACMLLALTVGGCKSGREIAKPPAPSSFPPQQQAQFRTIVTTALQEGRIPGAIVGIWSADKGNWVEAFGVADTATGDAMTTDHQVRIGSITKSFTATVILQLVNEGKIDLDDSIEKYVKKHRLTIANGKDITIRMLLNHTSGLFSYTDDPALEAVSYANLLLYWTPEELINYAVSHRDTSAPGEAFHYSNTGYALLGLIIEDETGHKLHDEIQHRLLTYLNMTRTRFPVGPEMDAPYARGYMGNEDLFKLSMNLRDTQQPQGMTDVTAFNPSWAWAGGGMVSAIHDLKLYAKLLATGDLVHKKLHRERLKTVPIGPGETGAGYGLGIVNLQGFLGHGGDIPGFNCAMYHSPELDATFIVLLNRQPNKADAMNHILLKLVDVVYPGKIKK